VKQYAGGERLADYARQLLRGEDTNTVATPQFQLCAYTSTGQVQTRVFTKRFAPPRTHKRIIIIGSENDLMQTVPFGYFR
jgi:hypothetical protein